VGTERGANPVQRQPWFKLLERVGTVVAMIPPSVYAKLEYDVMKTDSLEVGRVLQDNRRYTVPIYQRQYAWRDERLGPFWTDVATKAEEALGGRPRFMHYLGALILAPGTDGYSVGRVPTVQVVDGQQRLTTFQLFLAALRDVARRFQHPALVQSLDVYVRNDSRATGGDRAGDQAKLVPTPSDRELFRELMELPSERVRDRHDAWFFKNGKAKKGGCPAALWAYARFLTWIEQFTILGQPDDDEAGAPAEATPGEREVRLQALADALLLHMKLVIITLEEGDDAQVIFETLNSRGEPLLAMDLVRNNIFHRAEARGESAEALFARMWSRFDTPFWKQIPPRAKPPKPRIDFFLGHALTAQTGDDVSVRELYAEYRSFIRNRGGTPRFASVEEELAALVRFVSTYEKLEKPGAGTSLDIIGRRLATWEVTTAYPLVLCIETSTADAGDKAALYQLIYAYIVRRAICALTPKSLNKTFQRLVAAMLRDGVSLGTFAQAFADQSGPAVRFPGDDEFRAAVVGNRVYQQFPGKMSRLVDVLWELELGSRTNFQVDEVRPPSLTVEHVLPQKWEAHWPLPDGTRVPRDRIAVSETVQAAVSARDHALHTLGNLTLVTQPLNPSLSNREYPVKQGPLCDSLLALNVAFRPLAAWDETAIRERGERLAAIAVRLWPGLPVP
jgi:hypothetical protein